MMFPYPTGTAVPEDTSGSLATYILGLLPVQRFFAAISSLASSHKCIQPALSISRLFFILNLLGCGKPNLILRFSGTLSP